MLGDGRGFGRAKYTFFWASAEETLGGGGRDDVKY